MERRNVYRLAVCRRSRHLGLAVLRDSTLIAVRTHRLKRGERPTAKELIQDVADTYLVEELVLETGSPLRLPRRGSRIIVAVALTSAKAILLPATRERGHQAVFLEICRRYPALRHRHRPSRDRVAQLLAVVLAVSRVQEQHQLT